MIYSMTGFGQAQAEKKRERIIVTLRSVNHRYLETSFHIPAELNNLEAFFRDKVREKIQRGRLTISVSLANNAPEEVVLNEGLVKQYFKVLEKTRKRLKLGQALGVADLISLPGTLSYRKKELGRSDRESLIKSALSGALKKLVDMRRREGRALGRDLKNRVRNISRHMTLIKKYVKEVLRKNKKAMSLEAFESFLRNTDVSEEVTRIDFHLKSFAKHMRTPGPKGKVLDFIGQELQREINTLGAKVQDKHAAYQVVMIKDQIEKIREQVQNVE